MHNLLFANRENNIKIERKEFICFITSKLNEQLFVFYHAFTVKCYQ